MGFFSSSDDQEEESVEELNNQLDKKERELNKVKGENRLQDLKQSKREALQNKQEQLKKEKFKQTKAGKLINKLGEGLGDIAEATDSEKAAQLAETAEKVDGDGQKDTQSALGIGLEDQDKARDIEVEGNLEVEGDIVTEETSEPKLFEENENTDNFL